MVLGFLNEFMWGFSFVVFPFLCFFAVVDWNLVEGVV